MTPLVSVVMPILNGDANILRQSVQSIFDQTLTQFEFIIVDDGSDSSTKAILSEYAKRDERVVLIHNPINVGVGQSLNIGMGHARSEYFVRHDADDISLPERLHTLYQYMEENKDIALCCSAVNQIDMQNNVIGSHNTNTKHDDLAAELLLNSRICTPSTIVRLSVLKDIGGFKDLRNAEDYAMFLTLLKHGKQLGGIKEKLLNYRISPSSLTRAHRKQQLSIAEQHSYDYVCEKVGELPRPAFSQFWFFVALEGNDELKLSTLLQLKPLLRLIRTDAHHRKAWAGILKWTTRNKLDLRFSIKNLMIALYFRYVF